MNRLLVSRRATALTFALVLSACSSTPPDEIPSTQTAPGTQSRPILSPDEAQKFVQDSYFASANKDEGPWSPAAIALPQQPDFVVGPAGGPGVTQTSIQAAVDAAIIKHSSQRQFIAIQPGEYAGNVYIPAASGSVTLYGTTDNPGDVKITMPLDSQTDATTWRHAVNPAGKYMPGKPAWYMFDSCQNQQGATVGVMCSAVVWSQNRGLQMANLTIANTLGDSVDASNHQAVALRVDGDKTLLNNVHILGRQNSLLVTNSDVQNRFLPQGQPRILMTNSYIEGDVDMVAGRAAMVFDKTEFHLVTSRTQEGYVFAPATLPATPYGFLVTNSRLTTTSNGVAQLGRAWDAEATENGYTPGQTSNGQVVIRDSVISAGFNNAKPWADAASSKRPYAGNIGVTSDKGELSRDLNDTKANRLWEFNNRGPGSMVVSEAK